MRQIADQHPVVFETVVSAVLVLILLFAVLTAVVPRLEGGDRLNGGAVARTAIVGTVAFAVVIFVLLRIVYATG